MLTEYFIFTVRFDYYCYEDEEESVARGHLGVRDIFKGQINFAFEDFMPANFNCTVVVGRILLYVVEDKGFNGRVCLVL